MKKMEIDSNNKNNNNNKVKRKQINNHGTVKPYNKPFMADSKEVQHLKKKDDSFAGTCSGVKSSLNSGIFFETLRAFVSIETMSAITEMGLKTMTEIQAKTILKILEGGDLLATSKTGTGKTLAFLIPVVELMAKFKFTNKLGTGAIIISPTRELSIQTYGVLEILMKRHKQSCSIVTGGKRNINLETQRLSQGVNILVATPGRLLDHLQDSPDFIYKNLKVLILDEADRLFHIGFEKTLKKIVSFLPEDRQNILFSATSDSKTKNFAKTMLNAEITEVNVSSNKNEATVNSLSQVYIVCPIEKKLMALYYFIKKNNDKKGMVFFGSCNEVKYFAVLFEALSVPVKCIHGRLNQNKRTLAFHDFNTAKSEVLFCTDVAARGWDIPAVDWIIQFDPPADPKEYIHRVGRTARAGKEGYSVMYLRQEEINFISYLKEQKVNVNEMKVDLSDVENFQSTLQYTLSTNPDLARRAKTAVKSFLRSYKMHPLKQCFNLTSMNINQIRKGFGVC